MTRKRKSTASVKTTWIGFCLGVILTGVAVETTAEGFPVVDVVRGASSDSHPYSLSLGEVEAVFTTRLRGRGRDKIALLSQHFVELCQLYHFDPAFVLSLIQKESGFRTNALSKVGAVGLMQVMPVTADYIAERFGIEEYRHPGDLRDPFINLTLGVTYLAYLRDQFRHSQRFLAAYNLGPTTVRRMVERGAFRVDRVRRYVTGIENGEEAMRQEAKRLGLELVKFSY